MTQPVWPLTSKWACFDSDSCLQTATPSATAGVAATSTGRRGPKPPRLRRSNSDPVLLDLAAKGRPHVCIHLTQWCCMKASKKSNTYVRSSDVRDCGFFGLVKVRRYSKTQEEEVGVEKSMQPLLSVFRCVYILFLMSLGRDRRKCDLEFVESLVWLQKLRFMIHSSI